MAAAVGEARRRRLAREQNVRFVRLVFADIFGVSKNVSIPIDELDAALDGRITFDGGSIDGFVRGEELDMLLRPDPSTFAIYPWRAAGDACEARLICDIAMPDGSPFEGLSAHDAAPRHRERTRIGRSARRARDRVLLVRAKGRHKNNNVERVIILSELKRTSADTLILARKELRFHSEI